MALGKIGNGSGRWAVLIPAAGIAAGIFWFFVSLQSTADKVQKLDDARLDSRLTKLETSMIEIETQFCGNDVVRNLMHANDPRALIHREEKLSEGSAWTRAAITGNASPL